MRTTLAILLLALVARTTAANEQPDVVFIIVDDLNDWLGCLGGHPEAKSPNIDALAASGMLFTQAYCNSPQCRPSRTSLNHGVYPFKTGTYFNAKGKSEAKITTPTLQQFFLDHGYRVASGGKVHHGGPGNAGDACLKRPKDPKPPEGENNFGPLNPPNDGYALDVADEEMGDFQVAKWAIGQWREVTSNRCSCRSASFDLTGHFTCQSLTSSSSPSTRFNARWNRKKMIGTICPSSPDGWPGRMPQSVAQWPERSRIHRRPR